ncbi:hypothetical protein B0H10DRAFT_334339 [Mycena sp. CBHHK59/15]|nr:hypothetical protein B0H10DRAFT_334339 [Mycena sp. CBHHK59/15]
MPYLPQISSSSFLLITPSLFSPSISLCCPIFPAAHILEDYVFSVFSMAGGCARKFDFQIGKSCARRRIQAYLVGALGQTTAGCAPTLACLVSRFWFEPEWVFPYDARRRTATPIRYISVVFPWLQLSRANHIPLPSC